MINILREAGLDPGPKRGVGSWSEFLTRHAATLWASDFLTVKTWTTRGIVDLSVLFFIHPGTRKVFIGGVSANPDAAWMRQQARNATMRMEEMGHPVSHLIIDHDGKYGKEFDAIFEAEGARCSASDRGHRISMPTRNASFSRSGPSVSIISCSAVRSMFGTC